MRKKMFLALLVLCVGCHSESSDSRKTMDKQARRIIPNAMEDCLEYLDPTNDPDSEEYLSKVVPLEEAGCRDSLAMIAEVPAAEILSSREERIDAQDFSEHN